MTVGEGQRELEFEAVSAFEKLFSDEEGIRLSDSNQMEVWGETGLKDVTGVVKQVIWGPGDKINGPVSSPNFSGLGPFAQIARYAVNAANN